MCLLVDRRGETQGQPGLHALIAAVDRYPHLEGGDGPRAPRTFGLGQLSSAVPTAVSIISFLQRLHLPVPLATVRLLASGSSDAQLLPTTGKCTIDSFLRAAAAWRRDALTHPDNVTWLYVVGHGLQLSRTEQLFLTEDFGNGLGALLRSAVDMNNIVNGMAASRFESGMARTQFYFVDLSRVHAQGVHELQWQNSTAVFDVDLPGFDEREAAVYYAAEQGHAAFGVPGSNTLFSEALIECLEGEKAAVLVNDRWCVTSTSLATALNNVLAERTAEFGIQQRVVVGGSIRNSVVCYLQQPPNVDVSIVLEPPEVVHVSRVQVHTDTDDMIHEFPAGGGNDAFRARLQPGVYRVSVITESPEHASPQVTSQLAVVWPPSTTLHIRVPARQAAVR